VQLALDCWKPGTSSRHELDKTHASDTGPGSSLPSQPRVQPFQGIWVHWPLQNCCPKPLGMPVLTETVVSPAIFFCDFYWRATYILPHQLLQALPEGLCLGIVPRGELTRTGITKEMCTQHQCRKRPCTAGMRFTLMLHAEDLKTSSIQIWFFFTNSVQRKV